MWRYVTKCDEIGSNKLSIGGRSKLSKCTKYTKCTHLFRHSAVAPLPNCAFSGSQLCDVQRYVDPGKTRESRNLNLRNTWPWASLGSQPWSWWVWMRMKRWRVPSGRPCSLHVATQPVQSFASPQPKQVDYARNDPKCAFGSASQNLLGPHVATSKMQILGCQHQGHSVRMCTELRRRHSFAQSPS